MKKRLAAVGMVGACAVCCAPWWLPALVSAGFTGFAAFGSGLLAGISLDAVACGALALAALGGLAVWAYRARKAAQAQCHCESSCGTAACETRS